jgi:hypothetical protein
MHKRPILSRRLGVFVLFNAPALHVFSSAVPACKTVFATPMAKVGIRRCARVQWIYIVYIF